MSIDERQLFEAVEMEISGAFRQHLEHSLRAAATEPVLDDAATRGASGLPVLARESHRGSTWVTLSAAALLVVALTAVVLVRLNPLPQREPTPKPNPSTTTNSTTTTDVTTTTLSAQQLEPVATGQRPSSGAVVDLHSIDLDPWLAGAPPLWSATDTGGPYLIFDVTALPPQWTATTVEGTHPLGGPRYQWTAHLLASLPGETTQLEATLVVGGPGFAAAADSTEVTIRGRNGFASSDPGVVRITWPENDLVGVTLTSATPGAFVMPQLLDLARSLLPIEADSLGGLPPWPPANTISFDVGEPEFGGLIGDHVWSVDTGNEANTRALYPRVDGVLLGGIDTRDADPPPGYQYAIATSAVIGGVLVLAVLPTDVDHAVVWLTDGTTVEVPGYRWTDRVGIVVPIPTGLDVIFVDFVDMTDRPLHRVVIPEYPPNVFGASLAFFSELVTPPPLATHNGRT